MRSVHQSQPIGIAHMDSRVARKHGVSSYVEGRAIAFRSDNKLEVRGDVFPHPAIEGHTIEVYFKASVTHNNMDLGRRWYSHRVDASSLVNHTYQLPVGSIRHCFLLANRVT